MTKVHLEPYEIIIGANVGVARSVKSKAAGLKDAHGFDGPRWDTDIEGALGELAVAKAAGLPWSGSIDTFKDLKIGDVCGLQVRTSDKPNNRLIIRKGDPDEGAFVLVLGKAPDYNVVGYIVAKDAKNPEWEQAPNGRPPAYFVPQSALRPLKELAIARLKQLTEAME